MKYVQDYDNPWHKVGLLVICLFIVMVSYYGLRKLQKLDKEAGEVTIGFKNAPSISFWLCTISAELVLGCNKVIFLRREVSVNALILTMLLAIMAGCLIVACVMDLESCMIYDYVWWLGGGVGLVMLCRGTTGDIWELVLFILLQELLFCRVYGRADCHAFVICAMIESAMGMGMQEFLLQMLTAYGVLALVQGLRRNVSRQGNLKDPVPFLPYINISLWIVLYGHTLQWKNILLYIYTNLVAFF